MGRGSNPLYGEQPSTVLRHTPPPRVPLDTSVEATVRRDLINWPTLNKSRIDVLQTAFCVLGTGYEWVDGELVNGEPTSRQDQISPDPDEMYHLDKRTNSRDLWERLDHSEEEIEEKLQKAAAREAAQVRRNWDNLEQLATDTGELLGSPYPLCDLSNLTDIPDDVKDDWLLAAEEVTLFVLDVDVDGYSEMKRFPFADEERIAEDKKQAKIKHRKNQIHLQNALERIEQLKAARGL